MSGSAETAHCEFHTLPQLRACQNSVRLVIAAIQDHPEQAARDFLASSLDNLFSYETTRLGRSARTTEDMIGLPSYPAILRRFFQMKSDVCIVLPTDTAKSLPLLSGNSYTELSDTETGVYVRADLGTDTERHERFRTFFQSLLTDPGLAESLGVTPDLTDILTRSSRAA